MEFKFFSLRCWFLCMTSLAVTPSMLKTSVKFWGTSFKFWLCLWTASQLNIIYNNLFWVHIWLPRRFSMKSWMLYLNLLTAGYIWTIRCHFCIWNNFFLVISERLLQRYFRNSKINYLFIIYVVFNLGVNHLFCNEHSFLDLQLYPYSMLASGFNIVRLWDDIIDAILPVQLQLTFNIFWLNILCNGFPFGKCFLIDFKNILHSLNTVDWTGWFFFWALL